jgi:hypothetical protein
MSRRLLPVLAVWLCAVPLSAQDLRSTVQGLFQFGTGCAEPLCLNSTVTPGSHGRHFITALVTGSTSLIGFLTDAIGVSVSNVPLGATSSGVTFTFEGGVPVTTSVSAGPVFGERAQTLGKGRVLIGANATGVAFRSLRGVPLNGIVFDFAHDNGYAGDAGPTARGNPVFENDIFEVRPNFSVNVLVTSLYMTYGLLDRVDIGVAVPLVRTSVSGSSIGTVIPFGNGSPHFFGDTTGGLPRLYSDTTFIDGSATGVGDVAARVKINLHQSARAGFAILLDTRLPTGKEQDFLGSGTAAIRGLGIWSARLGDFSPHGNVGYLSRSGARENDAVLTTLGFDQLLSPWATMAVDFVGEWLVGESRLQIPGAVQIDSPFVRLVQPANIPNQHDHVVNASVGFKFNTQGLTIVTNALMPLRKAGLQSNFIWTVGLERNF